MTNRVAVAGAWRECECDLHQNYEAGFPVPDHPAWGYVLPKVMQVKCRCGKNGPMCEGCWAYNRMDVHPRASRQEFSHAKCGNCQGRDWTASTDLDTVLDCFEHLGFEVRSCARRGRKYLFLYAAGHAQPWGDGGEGDTWLDAAYQALARVLEAQGAQLWGGDGQA